MTKRIWAGPTFTTTTTTATTTVTAGGTAAVSGSHLDHGKSAAGAP